MVHFTFKSGKTFYCPRVEIALPASRADIQSAVKIAVENADEGTPFISILNAMIKWYGAHPYLKFVRSRAVHARQLERAIKINKYKEHVKAQREWFEQGGRDAHYKNKFGVYGHLDHLWLRKRLEYATGCSIDEEVLGCDPDPEEGEDYVPQVRQRACYALWYGCVTPKEYEELSAPYEAQQQRAPLRRSIMLLTKLRAYVRVLRTGVSLAVYNTPVGTVAPLPAFNVGKPEMDGVKGESVSQVTTSNVTLTEENPSGVVVAEQQDFTALWASMCSAEKPSFYNDLTDRFTIYHEFEWSKNTLQGQEVITGMDLPYDFVKSVSSDGSMPMFIPFKVFRYFKSDIEIKIHVNSNKFQCGQLQVSWQYMEKFDKSKFDNMYSRSQLPHVLINAGSSNEATLYIPYKHMLPYLITGQDKSKYDCLYLGTLRFFVVCPIRVADGGPQYCGVSVFIRFPNAEFTGMRDGSIGEPEMMPAVAMMAASKVVDKALGDVNCDMPTTNSKIDYIIPTASHSWSIGSGMNLPMHKLVLEDNKQTVNRPIGVDNSETNVALPSRVFGMLKTIEWRSTSKDYNRKGYMLWAIDAHPQVGKEYVNMIDNPGGHLSQYSLPPVSVVAGMFKYWRGSLEFRFDIVCSQFHTGRLLVAYIPGYYGSEDKIRQNISINQARNSCHATFTLQDSSSFTFVVPYIAQKPWWDRKYAGPHKWAAISAPSCIALFVLNPLVHMESICADIMIVPYIRAGKDFEVSIPVQPTNGLSLNTEVHVDDSNKIYPTTGSYPYRVSNYHLWADSLKVIFYEGTDTFGSVSTFHNVEKSLVKNTWYYGVANDLNAQPTIVINSKQYQVEYIVLIPMDGVYWGIPFPTGTDGKSKAEACARCIAAGKINDAKGYVYVYERDGSTSSSGNLSFTPLLVTASISEIDTDEDFSCLSDYNSHQMDNRIDDINSLNPVSFVPPTNFGNFMFRETFKDFKDLLRRFQLYCDCTFDLDKKYVNGQVVAKLPLLPRGMRLMTSKSTSIYNIFREGLMPLIGSAFIFFRGGLRIRIIVNGCINDYARIWVQHIPDAPLNSEPLCVTYPKLENNEKYRSHGYGFYVQDLCVNNIVEIEIPFYQPGIFGLNLPITEQHYSKDISQYCTLGDLLIGLIAPQGAVQGKVPGDVNLQVFYSISDDFSYNLWRGFPMVTYCDEVWSPDSCGKPQMFQSVMASVVGTMASSVTSMMISKPINKRMIEMRNAVCKDVGINAGCVIKPYLAEINDTVKDLKTELKSGIESVVNTSLLANAIGQLCQVIANPEPLTIGIAIGSILISLLSAGFNMALKLTALCKKFFSINWTRFSNIGTENAAYGNPEADFVDGSTKGLMSVIFTCICALIGCNVQAPNSYFNIMRNVASTAGLVNNLVTFLKNINEFIESCYYYIMTWIKPTMRLDILLCQNAPKIELWVNECQYLLDGRIRQRLVFDKSILDRVFNACALGTLYVSNGLNEHVTGGKIIWDTYKEISKLRNTLIEQGAHPDVRFETFPIWIAGQPGVGKSHIVTEMANTILKSINFQQPGSLIYYIKPGNKYWSGCQYPAVLVSDDMFQVSGTGLEEELANLFAICSSSVLNPPMAAVEEKDRRINPLMYFMLCNYAFPDLGSVSRCKEAVYRRRKFLIDVKLKPHIRAKYPNFEDATDLTEHERQNYNHLNFYIAKNVKDPATGYKGPMTYAEVLDVIKRKFVKHYEREQQSFQKRMCNMYSLDPNFDARNLITEIPELNNQQSLQDQMDAYTAYLNEKRASMIVRYNDFADWSDYLQMFVDRTTSAIHKMTNLFEMSPPRERCENIDADCNEMMSYADLPAKILEALVSKDAKIKSLDARKLIKEKFRARDPEFAVIFELIDLEFLTHIFKDLGEVHMCFEDIAHPLYNCDYLLAPFYNYDDETYGKLYKILYGLFLTVIGTNVPKSNELSGFTKSLLNSTLYLSDILRILVCCCRDLQGFANILLPNARELESPNLYIQRLDVELLEDMFENAYTCWERKISSGAEKVKDVDPSAFQYYVVREVYQYGQEALNRFFKFYISKLVISLCINERVRDTMEEFISMNNYFEVNDDLEDKAYLIPNNGEHLDTFVNAIVYIVYDAINVALQEDEGSFSDVVRVFMIYYKAAYALFKPNGTCSTHPDKKLALYTPSLIKYCALRHKFTIQSKNLQELVLTQCKCKFAICGDSFIYYLFLNALGVCVRPAVYSTTHNHFFESARQIQLKRNGYAMKGSITHAKNSLSCFIFHAIPRVAMKVLYFVQYYLPHIITVIIALTGAYKLITIDHKAPLQQQLEDDMVGKIMCVGSGMLGAAIYDDGSEMNQRVQRWQKSVRGKNNKEMAEAQSWFEASTNYYKEEKPGHAKLRKVPVNKVVQIGKAQSGLTEKCVMSQRIQNNMVIIRAEWEVESKRHYRICKCLMLGGRSLLMLRHYVEEYAALIHEGIDLNMTMFFYSKSGGLRVNLHWKDLLTKVAYFGQQHSVQDPFSKRNISVYDSNICVVELPKQVPAFKDIIKHIASRKDQENVAYACDLYNPFGQNDYNMPVKPEFDYLVLPGENSSGVQFRRGYRYLKHAPGMCGTLVVSPKLNSGTGAIVGIHVAGNEKTGYGSAEILCREDLEEYFAARGTPPAPEFSNEYSKVDVIEDYEIDKQITNLTQANVQVLGVVPPEQGHKESGKSKIVPSLLHGSVYPVRTEPNPLRRDDPRQPPGSDPLLDGCRKHGSGEVKPFDPDLIKTVQANMQDRMQQLIIPVRAKIEPLTMQQTVCGDVSVPYFEALNWKSSEGFPLNCDRPKSAHDKRWLFDLTEGQFGYELKGDGLHVKLKEILNLRQQAFENGENINTIYIDCLKDYRLTPAKCKIPGKTRIFSIAPIQCTLEIKQYMGDYTAAVKNSRIKNSIGIGINPDSYEWTDLVQYLFEVGNKIISIDYSNFGPCLMSQVVEAAATDVRVWYKYNGAKEEHCKKIDWLMENDIINPKHLCGNIVYQCANGIASGSPLTGEMNSNPNLYYVRLIYLEIMNEHMPDYASMYFFNQFIRVVVYGDDLIMCVSDEISNVYNALTMRTAFLKHGITITSAQKDGELQPYSDLQNSTFLKRGFSRHPTRPGVWLAPLCIESIEEAINWVHISDDPREAQLECCRASLDLAYGRGPDYYNEHYNKIKKALAQLNLSIDVKNWYERDNEIFSNDVTNVTDLTKILAQPAVPWWYGTELEEDISKLSSNNSKIRNKH